jgi:glycosyltransferase involved in cell wall biosynthesis
LTILGEGIMRDQIATLVAELGLEDRVTLAEPSRDVAAFHQRHDAFVLVSKWEGQSNALLEAMASGMPILVSDIPVFREVVKDAAVFVSPDEGDIARGLHHLRSMSREERCALGRAARERVASTYSAASTTRRLERAYESLIRT